MPNWIIALLNIVVGLTLFALILGLIFLIVLIVDILISEIKESR